jgi:DNA-binding LacI/PurR family transcriptional regulator
MPKAKSPPPAASSQSVPRSSEGRQLVSMKDIARAAGVHLSTVSRALSGIGSADNPTAVRIRQIAKDAGFTPNAVGRSLVTQKTAMVGVVVTVITDPFHHEIISGLDEVATEHNYSVVIADSQGDPERELNVVRSFLERRVDAIVVLSSRVGARYTSLLSARRIPIVLVNNQRRDQFVHAVTIDNIQAAFDAVQYLVGLGHKRIGYLGNQNGVYSDAERFSGYRQALAEANFPLEAELVAYSSYEPETSGQAMAKLLALARPPTAVFCYNDMLALGAMQATFGVARVPQDISVVGFDDLFFARFLRPALTTILQPKKEMGRLAMEVALKLVDGQAVQETTRVSGQLIVRESTAPPFSGAPIRVSAKKA